MVFRTSQAVGIQPYPQSFFFFGDFGGSQKKIQFTGGFTVSAEDEFAVACEIIVPDGIQNFLSGGIHLMPEGVGISDAVLQKADAEGASAVAFIRDVGVYGIVVGV